jgi:hypothetical protein
MAKKSWQKQIAKKLDKKKLATTNWQKFLANCTKVLLHMLSFLRD